MVYMIRTVTQIFIVNTQFRGIYESLLGLKIEIEEKSLNYV